LTNTIGPVTVPDVNVFTRDGIKVTIRGTYTNDADLQQLRELFRKAASDNFSILSIIGGYDVAFDLTDDSMLTQYCSFDSTKIKTGWYALIGYVENVVNSPNVWGFTASLILLGPSSILQDGFNIIGLDELTNNWNC
jgi:hypothetical protein